MYFIFLLVHTLPCSGLTFGSVLSNYSWQALGTCSARDQTLVIHLQDKRPTCCTVSPVQHTHFVISPVTSLKKGFTKIFRKTKGTIYRNLTGNIFRKSEGKLCVPHSYVQNQEDISLKFCFLESAIQEKVRYFRFLVFIYYSQYWYWHSSLYFKLVFNTGESLIIY